MNTAALELAFKRREGSIKKSPTNWRNSELKSQILEHDLMEELENEQIKQEEIEVERQDSIIKAKRSPMSK